MKLPHYTKFTLEKIDQNNLIRLISDVLDIMQEERDFAGTHAQRNAYRNVARLRLERLSEMIALADTPQKPMSETLNASLNVHNTLPAIDDDDIPF
jgi:hypothetical protein